MIFEHNYAETCELGQTLLFFEKQAKPMYIVPIHETKSSCCFIHVC